MSACTSERVIYREENPDPGLVVLATLLCTALVVASSYLAYLYYERQMAAKQEAGGAAEGDLELWGKGLQGQWQTQGDQAREWDANPYQAAGYAQKGTPARRAATAVAGKGGGPAPRASSPGGKSGSPGQQGQSMVGAANKIKMAMSMNSLPPGKKGKPSPTTSRDASPASRKGKGDPLDTKGGGKSPSFFGKDSAAMGTAGGPRSYGKMPGKGPMKEGSPEHDKVKGLKKGEKGLGVEAEGKGMKKAMMKKPSKH
ncbi:unnamed protein product [Amoebophrya sp. A25]|nr:unnamed protein product [Amoebophrya sp. A25]|eukprot:GSA25T00000466001.1